jgi:hypothetical protein
MGWIGLRNAGTGLHRHRCFGDLVQGIEALSRQIVQCDAAVEELLCNLCA